MNDVDALELLGAPLCGICGLRYLDWGTDFLGRVYCAECALVEDAARQRDGLRSSAGPGRRAVIR